MSYAAFALSAFVFWGGLEGLNVPCANSMKPSIEVLPVSALLQEWGEVFRVQNCRSLQIWLLEPLRDRRAFST